ncbi:MAG: amino acid carrier protein [Flavobacteriales bacterium]|jgi:AGCS family alanine or glycine:cation symporter
MTPAFRAALTGVLFLSLQAGAQLNLRIAVSNPTQKIKDGSATVEVSGGEAPYTFYWSKKDTPLSASSCEGMDEGVLYTVRVTDTKGLQSEGTALVPTESASEWLNSSFTPLVDALALVLFWDPFAAFGIYDPVVYQENGDPLLHPNGDPVTQDAWLVVVLLIAAALFFTVYMGFVNFRAFGHAIHVTLGRYSKPGEKGEVTHFQSLATALSGTLGLGNISLVAVAIAVGGPGATFWMIVAGLIGMTSKFVECTLGVKYRNISPDGEVSGGPMYYLSKGLSARGLGKLGKVLAVVFAVMCVGGSIGGGNMIQANQAFLQFKMTVQGTDHAGIWFGIFTAVMLGLVVIGGIKSIANVASRLVPGLVVVYVSFALIIIGMNADRLGEAFTAIIDGAFSPDAAKGGIIGVMLMGFRRASFSNEAGIGSASIVHSTSKAEYPISEGLVSLLEPFIDTVIVCTMTALVIIFTGFADAPGALTGSALTNAAFTSVFSWFDWILMVCIFLFAFSTMLTWSYYGLKSWSYLFGEKKWVKHSFHLLFMVCTVIGTVSGLGAVVDFSDMMILGMAFPNLIGLVIMAPEVKRDLRAYMRDLKSGVIRRTDRIA